tara:strand:- start:4422 stop:4829 length:408 start_codon:yes stop_codon:yes gene_type:complete
MKKVKQINLLQTKERLQQQKTISHLVQIQSETEKCIKIGNDLEELAKDKANDTEVANAYAFQANRQLMQKLMEQREILLNRQEYLEQEKIATSIEINQSIAKNEVLEKRKLKEKLIDARKKNTKIDENNFIPIKR